jgi:hypothetical protein
MMVTALNKQSPDDDPPRRLQLDDDLFTKRLCDFVSIYKHMKAVRCL